MATVEKSNDIEAFRHAVKIAAEGERTIIEIDGIRAAIVPVEDAEYMEALEDAQDIKDAMKEMDDLSDTISAEEVMKEYGLLY